MDAYRKMKLKNKKEKKLSTWNKYVFRILITAVLTLITLIALKQNKDFKEWFGENIYEKNINFASINKTYKKYFGSSFPLSNFFKNTTKTVFEEKLTYEEDNIHLDGVKLKVEDHYLVPILDMGMIIFIGEKEGYGNTVIIEQSNGIEVWYGNIKNPNGKLYDLKEKGEYLGEVEKDELYLVFKKDGKILNYKDYI